MYDSPRSSTNCGLLFVRRVYAYSARETITLTTAIPSPESNRSEEHTSELQSPCNLVCRLLLEKKKKFQSYTSNLDHRDTDTLSIAYANEFLPGTVSLAAKFRLSISSTTSNHTFILNANELVTT